MLSSKSVLLLLVFGIVLSVAPANAERLRLYEGASYKGSGRVFLAAKPTLDAADQGRFHSAKVVTGRWLVCDRARYAGNCMWIARNVPSFQDLAFSGDVGSLRPESVPVLRRQWGDRSPPSRKALVFFGKPRFEGDWDALPDSVADLRVVKARVTPSSVVLQTGAWRLCTLPNFEGTCLSLTASVWDLAAIFTTEIRSAQRLR